MKLALTLALAICLGAQQPEFDARSRLVQVPVTVMDARGHLIDSLDAGDFVVLDNGRPQKINVDTIDTGVAPIALVIAVQSSGISSAVLEKVRKVAGMVEPLITGERGCVGLVSFAEHVTWLADCTRDAAVLGSAFQQLRAGAPTQARMLDAVSSAIERLRLRPNARRVLLVISESRDRGSEMDLAVVTSASQAAGVTVYAATYSAYKTAFTSKTPMRPPEPQGPPPVIPNPNHTGNGNPPNPWNPRIPPPEDRVDILAGVGELARLHKTNTIKVLTAGTGGTALPFTRQKGLEGAIEKLGVELHSQYVLSFAPDVSTPGYHRIEVRLARGGEFLVRARPGYWLDAGGR